MKSKKAFLLGEYTLKIIIGALSLLLLVYLLYSLYSNSQEEKNLRMAESSLNDLVEGMNKAKETGIIQEVTLLDPHKWRILRFEKGGSVPGFCENNCICICYTEAGKSSKDNAEDCNKLGTCEDFEEKITVSNGVIGVVQDLKIEYKNKEFMINT